MSEYAQIQEIEIAKIKIGSRQRDEIGDVIGLAENIKARGLLHPIIVDDDYNLCAGYRRLLAHSFLGRKTILARFWGTLNELERKQIELEENLKRKQLTWEEECKAIAELHELMQKLNPQPIQTAIAQAQDSLQRLGAYKIQLISLGSPSLRYPLILPLQKRWMIFRRSRKSHPKPMQSEFCAASWNLRFSSKSKPANINRTPSLLKE